ncbi:MAG: hypothetical protein KatS3mg130_1567 [Candidatus Sumerlaea sp.]|uniref:Uncharacterized protein n=1 Tax=Sumerlaea chitinivorans TaxID=2250252 RepID=A0A2Z4Y1T9_SUMC1|nr:hypothetical protein BRCON_0217 [Candidatus Sumerlaea chitinivorans]GIX45159.1 MAG: hypothetical protein KatS3mg130_1567 [Candidatus Sumerlaea sp.]
MNSTKWMLGVIAALLALDVGLRLLAPLSGQPPVASSFVATAQAQTPIIGASLLPRYIVTTNQTGTTIYVWEDEGKGYVAKAYSAGR